MADTDVHLGIPSHHFCHTNSSLVIQVLDHVGQSGPEGAVDTMRPRHVELYTLHEALLCVTASSFCNALRLSLSTSFMCGLRKAAV